MSKIKIAALYQFAPLPTFEALRAPLQEMFDSHGIKGIFLVAHEGVNGTIAGEPAELDAAVAGIKTITGLNGFEYKESWAPEMPFLRMKVRLKKEIVTIGDASVDPLKLVGTYIEPEDWNAIISDPEVLVVDTRNSYEYMIGTFERAMDPQTQSFTAFTSYIKENFDPKVHKRIATFCTGGIRCEKATSFMLQEGFETVYHLKGGILNYLEKIPADQSLWHGGCFVFDQRVAIGHGLEICDITLCHGCRAPLSDEDRKSKKYEIGVSCPHCYDSLSKEHKASARERQRQVDLAAKRGTHHLGPLAAPPPKVEVEAEVEASENQPQA